LIEYYSYGNRSNRVLKKNRDDYYYYDSDTGYWIITFYVPSDIYLLAPLEIAILGLPLYEEETVSDE
jgi:hypothetical protein